MKEEHDEKDALSRVRLDPDFAEKKAGNGKRGTLLEEPSEFGVDLANCKRVMEKL